MKLKILSTTVLSSVLCLLALSSVSYAQANFAVCHREGPPTAPTGYHLIVVATQAVFDAHINHGDVMPTEGGVCPGGSTGGGGNPDPGAVPEPLTILLFGTGLAGVGYATRRWRKKGTTDSDEQV